MPGAMTAVSQLPMNLLLLRLFVYPEEILDCLKAAEEGGGGQQACWLWDAALEAPGLAESYQLDSMTVLAPLLFLLGNSVFPVNNAYSSSRREMNDNDDLEIVV